jgi:hypothetical protein
MKDYWAYSAIHNHPTSSRDGWQRLSEHLKAVRKLAGNLARTAPPKDDRLAKDAYIRVFLAANNKNDDFSSGGRPRKVMTRQKMVPRLVEVYRD